MLEIKSATVHRVKTMVDKSLEITLHTPELNPEVMTGIFSAYYEGNQGIKIDKIDIPEEKSPSRRLKDCIFRLWEKVGKGEDFEDYYKKYINMLCEKVKSNIP